MKKRKLTEEELREARRRALQRSAKDILYMGKILPNKDNPRDVAKYLAQELLDSPSGGARKLCSLIVWRCNVRRAERAGYDFRRFTTEPLGMPKREQRFLGQMLIALGEYLLSGKQMFDDLDFAIADIIAQCPDAFGSEVIRQLTPRYPILAADNKSGDKFRTKVEQRVTRLRKIIRPFGYGRQK